MQQEISTTQVQATIFKEVHQIVLLMIIEENLLLLITIELLIEIQLFNPTIQALIKDMQLNLLIQEQLKDSDQLRDHKFMELTLKDNLILKRYQLE